MQLDGDGQKSEAGAIDGTLTANPRARLRRPRRRHAAGSRILRRCSEDPAQTSDITGHATLDLTDWPRRRRPPRPGSAARARHLRRPHRRGRGISRQQREAGGRYRRATPRDRRRRQRLWRQRDGEGHGGGPGRRRAAASVRSDRHRRLISTSPIFPRRSMLPGRDQPQRRRVSRQRRSGGAHQLDADATFGESSLPGGTVARGTTAQATMVSSKAGIQSLTYAARGNLQDVNLRTSGRLSASPRSIRRTTTAASTRSSTSKAAAPPPTGCMSRRPTTADRFAGVRRHAPADGGRRPSRQSRRPGPRSRLAPRFRSRPCQRQRPIRRPRQRHGRRQLRHGRISGADHARRDLRRRHGHPDEDRGRRPGDRQRPTSQGITRTGAATCGRRRSRDRTSTSRRRVRSPLIRPVSRMSRITLAATNLAELGKLANQPISGSGDARRHASPATPQSLKTPARSSGANLGYQQDKALDLKSQLHRHRPESRRRATPAPRADHGHVRRSRRAVQINTLTATTTYADQKLDFQTHIAEAPGPAEVAERPLARPSHGRPRARCHGLGDLPSGPPGDPPAVAGAAHAGGAMDDRAGQRSDHSIRPQRIAAAGRQAGQRRPGARRRRQSSRLATRPDCRGIHVHAHNVDIAQLEQLALQNDGLHRHARTPTRR